MPDASTDAIRKHDWHDTRHHVPGGGYRNPWPLRAMPDEAAPGRLETAWWMLTFPFRRNGSPPTLKR